MKLRRKEDWSRDEAALGWSRGARIGKPTGHAAFTLLEVMIAVFIFFMAIFSILELVSQNLRMARSLQKNSPTAGMVASRISLTNKLEITTMQGDFEDYYPGYRWTAAIDEAGTNGLFQVDIEVHKDNVTYSTMQIFLYRPDSQKSVFGSRLRGR